MGHLQYLSDLASNNFSSCHTGENFVFAFPIKNKCLKITIKIPLDVTRIFRKRIFVMSLFRSGIVSLDW